VQSSASPLCRWLRQTLQAATTADASHLLDINVHLTKALSRSQSYASLSKVRRRQRVIRGGTEAQLWHSQKAPDCVNAQPAHLGEAAPWIEHRKAQVRLQALGKESMASDLDAAERADPASGGGLPAGNAVKAWHGRCGCGAPGDGRLPPAHLPRTLHVSSALDTSSPHVLPHQCRLCRPDFEATFTALAQAHPGTNIGVFYCGAQLLINYNGCIHVCGGDFSLLSISSALQAIWECDQVWMSAGNRTQID
jgi:Ferric reductase NAD binding domain